jgi:hypothetical protein
METREIRVKPQILQIAQIEEGVGDQVLNSPGTKTHHERIIGAKTVDSLSYSA